MNSKTPIPLLLLTLTTLLLLLTTNSTTAQKTGFRCTTTTITNCTSLITYRLPNTTTLSSITTLFQIKNLRHLLAANNLPPTTPKTHQLSSAQTLKIPFPCLCSNSTGISNRRPIYTVVPNDGLYHIAAEVFSGMVTYQQIQEVNGIVDPDKIEVGQKLWIPLPCSCDEVGGERVVHFGYLVAEGNTVGGIAEEFNTTAITVMDLNGLSSDKDLKADSIIDVPLKVCKTSVRNDSLDYPLLVPNGTYAFTANNCVRCECSAANNWILNCEPAGIHLRNGTTCPSMQCSGTAFDLGNTTSDSSCSLSRCSYGGYRNNTIYTELTTENTCPGGSNSSNTSPSRNGLKGLRWCFVVAASYIAHHLLSL